MINIDGLTKQEMSVLLQYMFHHLPMDERDPAGGLNRRDLGSEYPRLYNKVCGREIVKTTWPHERGE